MLIAKITPKPPSVQSVAKKGQEPASVAVKEAIPERNTADPEFSLSDLEEEKANLLNLIERFPLDAELNENLNLISQLIKELTVKPAETDVCRRFHSDVFNDDFTWNTTRGLLIFDQGAVYTETEIEEITYFGFEDLAVVHAIKSGFNVKPIGHNPDRNRRYYKEPHHD